MSLKVNREYYRPDIDGLRAIAVLMVVLFHCGFGFSKGGFIGVDIFFVISGYLITSIVFRSLDKGSFSLQSFHASRLRRILPAYFFVIFCSLIVALFLFSPSDFDFINESAIKSVLLTPNLFFARKLDYFAPESNEIVLLHLWSIGVELQFYLVWPIVLVVMHKLRLSSRSMLAICLMLVISLVVYSEWKMAIVEESSKAYYYLSTRSPALIIGASLAIIHLYTPHERKFDWLCQLVGFLLVLISFWFVDLQAYPGLISMLPSIGAALIIYAKAPHNLAGRVCSSAPLVHIGLLSYSVYLWHWPILAFSRYIWGELGLHHLFFIMVATYLASYVSWRFIEQKTQHYKLSFTKTLLLFYFLPCLIIGLLFFMPNKLTDGFAFRSDLFKKEFISTSDDSFCHGKLDISCIVGDPDGIDSRTLFVADSHGAHFEPLLTAVASKNNTFISSLSNDGCFLFETWNPTLDTGKRKCNLQSKLLNENKNKYETLILAGCWTCVVERVGSENKFKHALGELLAEISPSFDRVIILEQVPKFIKNMHREVFYEHHYGVQVDSRIDDRYLRANRLLDEISFLYKNVRVAAVTRDICKRSTCTYKNDGMPIYKDKHHLNISGSAFLSKSPYAIHQIDRLYKTKMID